MLGRLEMDVDECIGAYRELIESVFSEKARKIALDWSGNVKAQYDSQRLRAAIEQVITRSGASPSDLMNDGISRSCRVFVCTTSKETLEVARLRSYDTLDENTPSPTICEAALATSAATRFFEPVSLGDRQYVDGAFGANNPIEEVEEEACDIWCPSARNIQDLVKCLVSVGTGHAGNQALDDNILKFLSKTLVRMATKPAGVERRFMARWRRQCEENRCFRFSVEHGMEDVRMTDYQKRSLIEAATHDYLHLTRQKSAIHHCMLNLAGKRGKTDLDFKDSIQAYKIRVMQFQIETEINESGHLTSKRRSGSWLVPFQRNENYVDGGIMRHVSEKLWSRSSMSTVAIYGLGGVGKTQIALELAYRAQENHPDCSVFWIPAMSPESVHQAYLDISDHLGLRVAGQEKEEIVQLISEHFTRQTSGRWLLIFDNADDVDIWGKPSDSWMGIDFKNFLPSSPLGSIIFTTRSNKVALTLASNGIVHLPEMSFNQAYRVMKNLLVNKNALSDKVQTRELLERLTYLPLAIAQAAAFMNQNGTNVAEYTSLLDGHEHDAIVLLSEDFEDRGRYNSIRNPVATTWLTSFDQIRKEYPTATDTLAVMACLSSRDIPISLLPFCDKVEQQRILGLLEAYSLIRIQPNRQRLDLHRLVHLAMRNSMRVYGSLQAWEEWVMSHLASVFPTPDPQNQSLWREYLPHVFHILDLTSKYGSPKIRADLQWVVSGCLAIDGRNNDGATLVDKVIKFREKTLGPEHQDTLSAVSILATFYIGQGLLKEAEELEIQALKTRLRVFGPESLEVGYSLGNLCDTHLQLQNYRMAEWLGISALKSHLRHLGLEKRQSRIRITVMIKIYLSQGRLKNAMDLIQQLLSVTTRVCGPDDQDTFAVQVDMAWIYIRQCRLEMAAALVAEKLPKAEEFFGPTHAITNLYVDLSIYIMDRQARHLEAASLAIELASRYEHLYGSENIFAKRFYDAAEYCKNSK
ncbi:Acyl transferase/acyl hydrolase/lysophospholipase [Penicillium herquei]|nr:Acyl transferase/acyl hydrolase/lysophospholipase [Penicillium herquei]